MNKIIRGIRKDLNSLMIKELNGKCSKNPTRHELVDFVIWNDCFVISCDLRLAFRQEPEDTERGNVRRRTLRNNRSKTQKYLINLYY